MKRVPIPPKTELKQMYLVDKKSSFSIADVYGCTHCTVLKWLRYYKIAVRQRGSVPSTAVVTRKQQMRRDRKRSVCNTLKKHADDLGDDPERLTTEFMQDMIGVQCDNPNITSRR